MSAQLSRIQDELDRHAAENAPKPINVCGLGDFLAMDIPPRENLLAPWLPCQGLGMIYAPRGVGKTFVALHVAYAVASGGELFGRWKAPKPATAVYIDGEMPAISMQERLASILASSDTTADPERLRIITPDLQEIGMPDLSSVEDQKAIDACIPADTSLIVVDNLSTLVRSGKENESESWQPVQTWALAHRAQGRSVLFVHHAGKGGAQRGTSRREDVLDTVIALRRPADYAPDQGAVFEVHFEKARGLMGEDCEPFEARLDPSLDGMQWTTRSVEDTTRDRVVDLHEEGLKNPEIAAELGVHRSTVHRHLRAAGINPKKKG